MGLIGLAVGALTLVVAVRWVAGRFSAVTVTGASMEPELSDGDRVLIRRVPLARLTVGDIVVARTPGIPRDYQPGPKDRLVLIKRVAALPGEKAPTVIGRDERVPPEHLVLLSDNGTEDTVDSRLLGYFSADLILGRVVKRLG